MSADIDALSSADDAARADFTEDPVDQPSASCGKTAAMTLTVAVEPPPELALTVEVIPPAEE